MKKVALELLLNCSCMCMHAVRTCDREHASSDAFLSLKNLLASLVCVVNNVKRAATPT